MPTRFSISIWGFVLPAALAAQPASYTYLDQIPPYSNPAPAMLTALSTPKLGQTLELRVPYSWRQRNRAGADYLLATGLRNPFVAIPAFRGFLFTSAEIISQTPMSPLGAPGMTTLKLAVPNSAALIGFRFYQQVLEVTALPPSRVEISRGGVGVVGL